MIHPMIQDKYSAKFLDIFKQNHTYLIQQLSKRGVLGALSWPDVRDGVVIVDAIIDVAGLHRGV